MAEAVHAARLEERRSLLRERFGAEAGPRVLEIGSGHGHFLTAFGQAHPQLECIGVDIVWERVERAERKRARAGLGNVRFVRADIEDFLAALSPEVRFQAIFILFPDPWPKRRHHKYRLMQPEFLRRLAARSAPEAHLYFRTDHREYAAAAARALDDNSGWERVDAPWPFEWETVFQARAASHQSLVARIPFRPAR